MLHLRGPIRSYRFTVAMVDKNSVVHPTVLVLCVGASNLWERAVPAIRAHGALPPSWDGDASPARAVRQHRFTVAMVDKNSVVHPTALVLCVGASNLWERAVPAIRAHGALPR
ncbi:hypothetical protein RU08_02030 [Pseudomonas fulva]|uniref:Uncharacterized protein n=1 Tax=Pseudomonas fulva TaxID=47880 RepID=A0A0D0L7U7_9PSED|nr:hypothetical protein RU08_02030 [Pseudomonas fulva]